MNTDTIDNEVVRGRPTHRCLAYDDPQPVMSSLDVSRPLATIGAPVIYDWVGSGGMLEDLACGQPLEDLAGLDRSRWIVVGIEIALAESSRRTDCAATVRIFFDVVDKLGLGLGGVVDALGALDDYAARHGGCQPRGVGVV